MGDALWVLIAGEGQRSEAHVELAKAIWESGDASDANVLKAQRFEAYCKALCYAGQPEVARELVLGYPMQP